MKPIQTLLIFSAIALTSPALAQNEQTDTEKLRAELETARTELAKAARRMAQLQRELVEADGARHWIAAAPDGGEIEEIVIGDTPRFRLFDDTPRLGILVEPGEAGYEVVGVTPGGGAEAAGLQRGDRVVAVNGHDVADGETSIRDALEGLEAGTTVPVAIERADERRELEVETSAPEGDLRVFAHRFAPHDEGRAHLEALREGLAEAQREIIVMHDGDGPRPPLPPRLPGLFVLGGNSDLVGNHEGLAPYFGTGEGVIVLRIDADNPLSLTDGDVVLSIDGQPVRRPVDLGRAMLDREPGETVVLEVMRNGALTQIEGSVPDSFVPGRGHRGGFGLWMPSPPQAPAAP